MRHTVTSPGAVSGRGITRNFDESTEGLPLLSQKKKKRVFHSGKAFLKKMAMVKSGWLHRQSTILRRWKKNWFDLYSDGRLVFYNDQQRRDMEDDIHMKIDCINIRSSAACQDLNPPEGKSRDSLLQIVCRDGRVISMCADSADDALAWTMAFQDARVNMVAAAPQMGFAPETVASAPPPYSEYAPNPQVYVPGPYGDYTAVHQLRLFTPPMVSHMLWLTPINTKVDTWLLVLG
ncbi:hypothetical protein WMY93_025133 [Mugilogobius chulae]|uniref:PH domain-containing protein n=1 Tax=Mugilogobius chulae TaxID=88201 RepID=A0AAW0N4T3_9GOBI